MQGEEAFLQFFGIFGEVHALDFNLFSADGVDMERGGDGDEIHAISEVDDLVDFTPLETVELQAEAAEPALLWKTESEAIAPSAEEAIAGKSADDATDAAGKNADSDEAQDEAYEEEAPGREVAGFARGAVLRVQAHPDEDGGDG